MIADIDSPPTLSPFVGRIRISSLNIRRFAPVVPARYLIIYNMYICIISAAPQRHRCANDEDPGDRRAESVFNL